MKNLVSKQMKKNIAGLVTVLLIIIMIIPMTACRKNSAPENKENETNTAETDDSKENGEGKEEETESKALESEGDIEIILDEDEGTFGE